MDTKLLRKKILDLAIHGKLVPQDPNDEPASVLLERIRTEKEQLIKEGKIKRSKNTAASDTSPHENVPFEVSRGWVWTTLGEITINRDNERIPVSSAIRKKQTNKIYDYYGAAGVIDKVDSFLFNEKLLLVGEDGANLLSCSKNNAFFAEGKYWVNNHAHILDSCPKDVLSYIAVVINSMNLDEYITGSAQPKLSQDNLHKILIPLPPLAEQQRIVAEIEKWFAIIDKLEADKTDLQTVIKQTKSKILDLAIHGKLVSQDPDDEPAIELLKRINPNFTPCDNSHYEQLPQGWCYIRLGSLCTLVDGEKQNNILRINLDAKFLRGSKDGDVIKSGRFVSKGQLLTLVDGENSGEVFCAPIDGYQGSTFKQLDILKGLDEQYILYIINSYQTMLRESKTGSAIPHLNKKLFKDIMVQLPPFQEQTRISKQIENTFTFLDKIREML